MRQKVVLDTSALIIHGKGKQDVFELLDKFFGLPEVIVLSFIQKELERLANFGRGTTKVAAGVAMQMLDRVQVINANRTATTVDTSLINYAFRNKTALCTNDRAMRDRAKKKGITVVYVGEKYFKGRKTV